MQHTVPCSQPNDLFMNVRSSNELAMNIHGSPL